MASQAIVVLCAAFQHGLVALFPSGRGLGKRFFATPILLVKGADEPHKLGAPPRQKDVPRRGQPSPLLSFLGAPSRIQA